MELTVNRNIILFLCFLPVCWSHSSSCKVLRLVNTTYHHHFPSHYTQVDGIMCHSRKVYHNRTYYIWHQSTHMNWYIGEQSGSDGSDVQCDYTRGSISSVFGATGQFPEDSASWFERSDEHTNFDPTDAMVVCDEEFFIEVPLTTSSPTITTDVITPTGPTNLTGKEFSIEVPLTTSSPTVTIDIITPTGPTNLIGISVPLLAAISSGGVFLIAVIIVAAVFLIRRKNLKKNTITETVTMRNDANQDMQYAECGNITEEIIPMYIQDHVKTEQGHQIKPSDNQNNHAKDDDDVIIDNQLYGQLQDNPHFTFTDHKEVNKFSPGHEFGPKGDVYTMVVKSPTKMQAKQSVEEKVNVVDNYEDICVENTRYGML